LNQLQTDLFTAKSVGQKEDPKEISADNLKNKNPAEGRVFVFPHPHTKFWCGGKPKKRGRLVRERPC